MQMKPEYAAQVDARDTGGRLVYGASRLVQDERGDWQEVAGEPEWKDGKS